MTPPIADAASRWSVTWSLIRSDFARQCEHLGAPSLLHRLYYMLLPGFQALFWHRVSRCLMLRGWVGLSRFVALFAMYWTRAEVPPTSSFGPGALISHAPGVSLFGRFGARLTVQGDNACGGGFGIEDIGGGPGYPVLGDHVTLAYGARVLGAVTVGDGVKVGPSALVTTNVPPHSLVLWSKPRIIEGGTTAS